MGNQIYEMKEKSGVFSLKTNQMVKNKIFDDFARSVSVILPWQKKEIMEPVIHMTLILTVRHTTFKGILYTYLHADIAVKIFLDDAYLARKTSTMIQYRDTATPQCFPG